MIADIRPEIKKLFKHLPSKETSILDKELQSDPFGGFQLSNNLLEKLNLLIKEDKKLTKIKQLTNVYNQNVYNLEKSKQVIIESLNKLIKKYPQNNIPIVYTTEILPNNNNYSFEVSKQLFSISSFSLEDFGHLNLIDTILSLQKDKIIIVKSFSIIDLSDEHLTIKIIVDYIEILNDKNTYSIDKKFWFEGKTFFLRMTDDTLKSINLSITKKQGTNPYILMFGLVELLKKNGYIENHWFKVKITKQDLRNEIIKHTKNIQTIDDNWLKYTKSNLKKNIPEDIDDYIKISDFQRKKKHYIFEIKMPE